MVKKSEMAYPVNAETIIAVVFMQCLSFAKICKEKSENKVLQDKYNEQDLHGLCTHTQR